MDIVGKIKIMLSRDKAFLKRYLISGLTCQITELTFFNIVNTYIFNSGVRGLAISNALALFVGFSMSFTSYRFYVFKSDQNFKSEISKYSILFILNIFISSALIIALTSLLNIPNPIAKAITMIASIAWNFVIQRLFIFKEGKTS